MKSNNFFPLHDFGGWEDMRTAFRQPAEAERAPRPCPTQRHEGFLPILLQERKTPSADWLI
jgi:hypothetical protein